MFNMFSCLLAYSYIVELSIVCSLLICVIYTIKAFSTQNIALKRIQTPLNSQTQAIPSGTVQ